MKIIEQLQGKLNKKRFSIAAQKIRNTAPIELPSDAAVVVVSQVYHRALDMTLLALKSFVKYFSEATVELIDDGSLTKEDYDLLKEHLPGVIIVHINSIELGQLPSGGTWERLTYIMNRTQDKYVIQVDTDTITCGPIDDVFNAVKHNQGFSIGNPRWINRVPTEYTSAYAKKFGNDHVQFLGEQHLHSLNCFDLPEYLRVCSAFTGFPRGMFSMQDLVSFSTEMIEKLGNEKWNEWGSEQFSSNVMISKLSNSFALPWPKYQNFMQPSYTGPVKGIVSVFHFIGSHRYHKRIYEKLAAQTIKKLL
ncbi:hypothetical protein [Paraglaciecola sp. 2405UD69-4]|uniref:hypothetical protein n=1 Tax=Paraglaciecola sp. 2405UD69-4 TaxID=3391836 RepID=UPI0039C9C82D